MRSTTPPRGIPAGDGNQAPGRRITASAAQRPDIALLIGRAEPPTLADVACIRKSLAVAERGLFIAGSAFQSRSPRNPLYYAERERLLRGALTPDESARLDIVPLPDSYNTHAWITAVRGAVRATSLAQGLGPNPEVAIVGSAKGRGNDYPGMFPGWRPIEVAAAEDMSAAFCADYLRDPVGALLSYADAVPGGVASFLGTFAETPDYRWLVEEANWYQARREKFGSVRHLPPIVTGEGVVIQSGHVLLSERLKRPGLGLLALPGDTLREETFLDGVLRVLVDDLRLMVTDTRPPRIARSTVEGRIVADDIFDHPYRSERGHVISRAYLVELHDDPRGLPSVGKGTDAQRPFWMPIADIDPQTMFEDHYHVLNSMLARTRRR